MHSISQCLHLSQLSNPETLNFYKLRHGRTLSEFIKINTNFTNYQLLSYMTKSRDSSVGIALGYGLDDRGSRVQFPARVGNFSLHHRVQNGSGAHPASYPWGTRGCFLGGKTASA
jgi:hypothetical protein